MKIKVEVQEWRIEDENGNPPDEVCFIKEKLSLPDEVPLTVNYNDINDVDDIVIDELYKKTGFYPEVFTWVEVSD